MSTSVLLALEELNLRMLHWLSFRSAEAIALIVGFRGIDWVDLNKFESIWPKTVYDVWMFTDTCPRRQTTEASRNRNRKRRRGIIAALKFDE